MSKLFRIIVNILFYINAIILFSSYTHIFDFSFVKISSCSIVVFILLIVILIELKQKNSILSDNKYNIMMLLVNIIVLIIFWRDRFDKSIPLGSANDLYIFTRTSSGLFIDYNAILITIMYIGILLYNLINKDKAKKE